MQNDDLNYEEDFRSDDENERFALQSNQPRPLGRNQKIAVAVLAFFGFLVIVLWTIQFKKNISAPFQYAGDTNNSATADSGDDQDLKNKDTDKDGLSDYDELNNYNTSPYLEDSDSDGINDRDEIVSGKNPNCPEGKDCVSTVIPEDTSVAPTQNNALNQIVAPTALVSPTSEAPTTNNSQNIDKAKILQSLSNGTGSPAELRLLLLNSGMDKNMLDKISDEELMKSFSEAVGQ